jgi:hypothetical protein
MVLRAKKKAAAPEWVQRNSNRGKTDPEMVCNEILDGSLMINFH